MRGIKEKRKGNNKLGFNGVGIDLVEFSEYLGSRWNASKVCIFKFLKFLKLLGFCHFNRRRIYLDECVYRLIFEEMKKKTKK